MNLGDNLTEISELAKNGIVQAVENESKCY